MYKANPITQMVWVMGQRAILLEDALARGHIKAAQLQHERLLVLADRVLNGVDDSRPETREDYDATYRRSKREFYPPEL